MLIIFSTNVPSPFLLIDGFVEQFLWNQVVRSCQGVRHHYRWKHPHGVARQRGSVSINFKLPLSFPWIWVLIPTGSIAASCKKRHHPLANREQRKQFCFPPPHLPYEPKEMFTDGPLRVHPIASVQLWILQTHHRCLFPGTNWCVSILPLLPLGTVHCNSLWNQ